MRCPSQRLFGTSAARAAVLHALHGRPLPAAGEAGSTSCAPAAPVTVRASSPLTAPLRRTVAQAATAAAGQRRMHRHIVAAAAVPAEAAALAALVSRVSVLLRSCLLLCLLRCTTPQAAARGGKTLDAAAAAATVLTVFSVESSQRELRQFIWAALRRAHRVLAAQAGELAAALEQAKVPGSAQWRALLAGWIAFPAEMVTVQAREGATPALDICEPNHGRHFIFDGASAYRSDQDDAVRWLGRPARDDGFGFGFGWAAPPSANPTSHGGREAGSAAEGAWLRASVWRLLFATSRLRITAAYFLALEAALRRVRDSAAALRGCRALQSVADLLRMAALGEETSRLLATERHSKRFLRKARCASSPRQGPRCAAAYETVEALYAALVDGCRQRAAPLCSQAEEAEEGQQVPLQGPAAAEDVSGTKEGDAALWAALLQQFQHIPPRPESQRREKEAGPSSRVAPTDRGRRGPERSSSRAHRRHRR
eukprot:gene3628-2564_t